MDVYATCYFCYWNDRKQVIPDSSFQQALQEIFLRFSLVMLVFFLIIHVDFSRYILQNLKQYGSVVCKLALHFAILFSEISSWLIVAMVVELTVCACVLTLFDWLKRLRTADVVIGIVTLFLALLHSHLLYGVDYIKQGNASRKHALIMLTP